MLSHPPIKALAHTASIALLVALAGVLALLGLAVAFGNPLGAQEARYTRGVQVPAPGWVRVPLPPSVLRRAAPAGGNLRLFGPEGGEVPFRRVVSAVAGPPVPAEVLPAAAGDGDAEAPGIVLDTGAGGRPHDRLLLGPAAGSSIGPVLLEGSDDLESWELLAVAEPRPAGDGSGWLILDHPGSGLRYLRLAPVDGDGPLPAVASAAVAPVPERALLLDLPEPGCRSADAPGPGPRTVCRLGFGGAGRQLRRLDLTLTVEDGSRAVGYRLLAPEAGRWEIVAEGVWETPVEESRRSLGLDAPLAVPAEPLRLELYGGGDDPPGAAAPAAEMAPEELLFRARRPGRYTLAYGPGVLRSSASDQVRPPAGASYRVVSPGAAETGEPGGDDTTLPGPAGPAPAVRFAKSWPVRSEVVEEGVLHGLALPPKVYGAALPGLEDLRLVAEEVQIPFLRWRSEEPASVELEGREEDAGGDDGSRLRLDLAERGLPLSALVLHAPPERFDRRVRVLASGLRQSPGGELQPGPEVPVSPWLEWSCRPRPPLSCRLSVSLEEAETGLRSGSRVRRLTVETEGGDGAAGAAVPEVWRRQDVLIFPWPDEDRTPLLMAGAAGLEAPDYELERRRQELLARTWAVAELVPEGEEVEDGGAVGRWTVGLTLAAALALLLFLLDRILEKRDPEPLGPGRGAG